MLLSHSRSEEVISHSTTNLLIEMMALIDLVLLENNLLVQKVQTFTKTYALFWELFSKQVW